MKRTDIGMNQMFRADVIVNGHMKKPINCADIEPMSKTYLIVLLGSSNERDSMPARRDDMFTANKSDD